MPTIEEFLTPMRRERDHIKFVGRLADMNTARIDYVIPTRSVRARHTPATDDTPSRLDLTLSSNDDPFVLPSGVATSFDAAPTETALSQLAGRLRIPSGYLHRLIAAEGTVQGQLAATNINELAAIDDTRLMARLWHADDGYVLRSVVSDRYQAIDNWAVMSAFTQAMRQSSLDLADCEIDVDLSPDRFRMRVAVPSIAVEAHDLLADYRMPFSLRHGVDWHAPPQPGERPELWAGFELTNSEAGKGALTLAKRVVVTVCRNGLTRPIDIRRTHLGARLEHGAVDWSRETQNAVVSLVASQITDAVSAFCSTEALSAEVADMRQAKSVEVDSINEAVTVVKQQFQLDDAEQAAVLDAFTRGGDSSVLGLAQAVTAAAQLAPSGDRQSELETCFWPIVERPAAFSGSTH